MNKREQLWEETEKLPEAALDELLQVVRQFKHRSDEQSREITRASESVLARDWLRPEEDEAWSDL